MRIKDQKGIAGTDIAIAIIIITIFMALISNLIININLNSKDIKRKNLAISYATLEIEKIKTQGIEPYLGKGVQEEYIIEEDIKDGDNFSGFHKKITVKDYVLIKQDMTKQKDIVKEVSVEISYRVGNKEQSIILSTHIVGKE